MRIAQVAPLHESIPPKLYGGTERVVSFLTEELVQRGHDVTLYASGDSHTSARLIPITEKALRLNPDSSNPLALNILQLEKVFQDLDSYDIIHFHTDFLHFPLSRHLSAPQLTTLHGRLDTPELILVYNEYGDMPVVSISDSQRHPLPMANWQATIYNGIDAKLLRFNPEPGHYLAFLGRISPEKGIEVAIEIALRSGMELQIAAKIDPVDRLYFTERICHHLEHPLIHYRGEITEGEKSDFLGNAAALLFPVQWPEPFGLVMIESFACGTPVLAFNQGSVPEVIQDFITGFIVESIDDAVASLDQLELISRYRCRDVFEKRFSAAAMAEGYLNIYDDLVNNNVAPHMAAAYQNSSKNLRKRAWKKS